MTNDQYARVLGTQACSTISVNGNTFTSSGNVITLPNYPADGEPTYYTAGDNIEIDENDKISATYEPATTLVDGLLSSEDYIKLQAIEGDVDATPSTHIIRDSDADARVNGVDFDLTPTTDETQEGHMQWNKDEITLSIGTTGGSSLQVNQENVAVVRNGTNDILTNGTVCYWTDGIGVSGKISVDKFIADGTINTERCLGIITRDVAKNETCHATWYGKIKGIDTTGTTYSETWAEGDIIYASSTIAGGITNVRPTYPNLALRLGIVIEVHAINGIVFIKPTRYSLAEQVDVKDVGTYYDGTNTETVLQELGDSLTSIYDDLPPIPLISSKVGSIAPVLTTFIGNIKQYTFGVNDEVYGTSELTHLYKEGSDIISHVHWVTNGVDTTDRDVKWELEYAIGEENEAFPTTSTTIVINKTIDANTVDRTHYITDFPTIDGTNIKVGAYIVWRLRRITADGTAPSSNPFGLAIGAHTYMSILE